MRAALAAAIVLLATPALAADPPAPVSTTVGVIKSSMTGQPIVLPQGRVEVTVTETVIPVGGMLAAHKHPWPRFAYIQAGRLQVTNLETGTVTIVGAGDVAADAIDQWHEGRNIGEEPVRLLVFDPVPPGQTNTIRKAP